MLSCLLTCVSFILLHLCVIVCVSVRGCGVYLCREFVRLLVFWISSWSAVSVCCCVWFFWCVFLFFGVCFCFWILLLVVFCEVCVPVACVCVVLCCFTGFLFEGEKMWCECVFVVRMCIVLSCSAGCRLKGGEVWRSCVFVVCVCLVLYCFAGFQSKGGEA